MCIFLTVVMLPGYTLLFDWHSQEPGTTVQFVSKHPLWHRTDAFVTSFYTQNISRAYVHTLTVVWHTLAHRTLPAVTQAHKELTQTSEQPYRRPHSAIKQR